jgi:hypothetical protein
MSTGVLFISRPGVWFPYTCVGAGKVFPAKPDSQVARAPWIFGVIWKNGLDS